MAHPAGSIALAGSAALLALSLAAASGGPSSPESRAAWLGRNVVPLDPVADSADELAALEESFAGRDLVLLGEATRGDGSTFAAKTALVRFLHEELGFDVLVFECGLFDCDRAWREIRAGRSAEAALESALFPLYTRSEQFRGLLELVEARARTDRPLEIAGIDPQVGTRDVDALLAALHREVAARASGAPPPYLPELVTVVRRLAEGAYTTGEEPVPDRPARARIDGSFAALSELLASPPPTTASDASSSDFWVQVVANLRAAARQAWALGVWEPSRTMAPEIHNLRDRRMAENLLWLRRQRYPGRKIVVWSLTLHLARDLERLETGEVETGERFRRFDLLGERLARALDPDPYVVAFTAYDGRKGSIFQRPHALLVPTEGSFEDLMGRTGLPAAFVDLRRLERAKGGRWLARPLIARPIAFKELRGVWSRHVDAFYYLRTLEPARRAAAPRSAATP